MARAGTSLGLGAGVAAIVAEAGRTGRGLPRQRRCNNQQTEAERHKCEARETHDESPGELVAGHAAPVGAGVTSKCSLELRNWAMGCVIGVTDRADLVPCRTS